MSADSKASKSSGVADVTSGIKKLEVAVSQSASAVLDSKKPDANAFYSLLAKTQVKSIVPKRKLVGVYSQDTLLKAVITLCEHQILSAPVFDSKENCVGSVDMLDAISYLFVLAPKAVKPSELNCLKLDQVAVQKVMDASKRNPLMPFFEDNPLSMLVEWFATGVHRAVLFEGSGEVTNTISQSDVVKFLFTQLATATEKQKSYIDQTCKQLGLGHASVVAIDAESSVKTAVDKLRTVSGVALVDSDGKLVGNFSAPDCSRLYSHGWDRLYVPCVDYLQAAAPKSLKPVTASPDDTLRSVITKLVENRVHRLWIVDGDHKPVNVISLTDVMTLFSSGERITARQAAGDISKLYRSPPDKE